MTGAPTVEGSGGECHAFRKAMSALVVENSIRIFGVVFNILIFIRMRSDIVVNNLLKINNLQVSTVNADIAFSEWASALASVIEDFTNRKELL
jgi:hypothetical protein